MLHIYEYTRMRIHRKYKLTIIVKYLSDINEKKNICVGFEEGVKLVKNAKLRVGSCFVPIQRICYS